MERLLHSVLQSVRPSENKKQLKNQWRDFCKILSSGVITKFVEQLQFFFFLSDDVSVELLKNKLSFWVDHKINLNAGLSAKYMAEK